MERRSRAALHNPCRLTLPVKSINGTYKTSSSCSASRTPQRGRRQGESTCSWKLIHWNRNGKCWLREKTSEKWLERDGGKLKELVITEMCFLLRSASLSAKFACAREQGWRKMLMHLKRVIFYFRRYIILCYRIFHVLYDLISTFYFVLLLKYKVSCLLRTRMKILLQIFSVSCICIFNIFHFVFMTTEIHHQRKKTALWRAINWDAQDSNYETRMGETKSWGGEKAKKVLELAQFCRFDARCTSMREDLKPNAIPKILVYCLGSYPFCSTSFETAGTCTKIRRIHSHVRINFKVIHPPSDDRISSGLIKFNFISA